MGGHRSRTLVIRPNRAWKPITRMGNVLLEVQFAAVPLFLAPPPPRPAPSPAGCAGTCHLRNILHVAHVHKH